MMSFLIVAAGLAAIAAAYAQRRIPDFTAVRARAALTRTLLALVGLAMGYVGVTACPEDSFAGLLAFIIGFGAVHIPAALILFIKGQRRAGKS